MLTGIVAFRQSLPLPIVTPLWWYRSTPFGSKSRFFPTKKAFFFQGSEECRTMRGGKRGWRTCGPSVCVGGGWDQKVIPHQVEQAETSGPAAASAVLQPLPAFSAAATAVWQPLSTVLQYFQRASASALRVVPTRLSPLEILILVTIWRTRPRCSE